MNPVQKKILLVEDEPNLRFTLELNLQAEGFSVVTATSGEKALKEAAEQAFDLILLDWMIPAPDGYAVAKSIRARDKITPIFMITARAGESDRLQALELAIDDYICKPFHLKELLLKVKRILNRTDLLTNDEEPIHNNTIACGMFVLNKESLELTSPRGKRSLTVLEAEILWEFMTNKNRVLSREHLLERVWGVNAHQETRTVDNFVVRIRKYIEENPAEPLIIESVRGRGYRFNEAQS